jgi:hypothetical protein
VVLDVGDEDEVLLRRPRALLDALLVAARRPRHGVFTFPSACRGVIDGSCVFDVSTEYWWWKLQLLAS